MNFLNAACSLSHLSLSPLSIGPGCLSPVPWRGQFEDGGVFQLLASLKLSIVTPLTFYSSVFLLLTRSFPLFLCFYVLLLVFSVFVLLVEHLLYFSYFLLGDSLRLIIYFSFSSSVSRSLVSLRLWVLISAAGFSAKLSLKHLQGRALRSDTSTLDLNLMTQQVMGGFFLLRT